MGDSQRRRPASLQDGYREEVTTMKVVRKVCCGLDVHKTLVVATVATTNAEGITSYEQRSFGTIFKELLELRDWLVSVGCDSVCMESTGKYWIPVYNALETKISEVCLTHPKYVRAIKGKKTDKKDSKWIADLFKEDLVRASFIPPKDIRECREISRYRAKLVQVRSSERCRYQDCLTTSNIGLASVLSDATGATARAVMEQVTSEEGFDEQKCLKLIKGRAKAKSDRIIDAVRNADIRPDQGFKMREALAHMEELDGMIARCELELHKRMEPHWDAVKLICQLPGVSELSAMLILSETGVDMDVFEDADEFCCWCGLVPADDQSNGKKKSTRITRAGQYLKPLIVQCALAAIRSTQEDYFAIKYKRLRKRRGHKKAIIAIARKMMVCIYHMLKNGEAFDPSDYERLKNPKQKQRRLTERSALELLRELGYEITKVPAV